jgi:hypothetical protein
MALLTSQVSELSTHTVFTTLFWVLFVLFRHVMRSSHFISHFTSVTSHFTSQVIEHRELNAVWTELLSSGDTHGNAVGLCTLNQVDP